jgi:hypothetical protein
MACCLVAGSVGGGQRVTTGAIRIARLRPKERRSISDADLDRIEAG